MWAILSRVLLGALGAALPSLVGRILLALGIGFVSYQGLSVGTNFLMTNIQSNFAGLPSTVAGFLGFCYVDRAINLIGSTFLACLSIKTLQTSSITKMVFKSK